MGLFSKRALSGKATSETAARDIAAFDPTLYTSALSAAGRSATEHNVEAVARLTAVNLALNAHGWFDALGDAGARSRFDAQFNANNKTPARHVPDDMVDFLWAWTSRCHPALRDFADQMVKTIVSSASRFGDPLPADLWSQE
jgi:hypothetical protein